MLGGMISETGGAEPSDTSVLPGSPSAAARAHPAPPVGHVHQMAATKLASVSQRYTANRRAVVDALLALPGPATIAEILGAGQGLAQSSTYRNLVVLEQVGVVHRIVTSDDHARFELTEEITGNHHHHLICESCGLIIDVLLDPALERALETALDAAADVYRFKGQHHRVDLAGLCQNCQD